MIDQMRKHRSRLKPDGRNIVTEQKLRIITPEQKTAGYMRLSGVTPSHHEWVVVGKTEHGDYIVLEPDPTRQDE